MWICRFFATAWREMSYIAWWSDCWMVLSKCGGTSRWNSAQAATTEAAVYTTFPDGRLLSDVGAGTAIGDLCGDGHEAKRRRVD
mmetsp:Transcript_10611/g.27497  ORF Transcript_10611/g.27497 Transcript_10611/m.27497 type:complete len:84 (+) Transcript_10611:75-326(+)